jgi:hypothetical protein
MYICMYVHACMHACMYACMYVRMDGWMDGCKYVCMLTHILHVNTKNVDKTQILLYKRKDSSIVA